MTAASLKRGFFKLPIIGRIAREVAEDPDENLLYLLAALICLWLISGLLFGLPGLVIPMAIAGPAFLVLLMVMVWG